MTALVILLSVVGVATFVAFVVAWAEIFLKAGYNRWLCLAMIVPVVNIAIILWFAFSRWPVYEFVEKGWYVKKLRYQQEKIASQVESLGETMRVKEMRESPTLSKPVATDYQQEDPRFKTPNVVHDDSPITKQQWIMFGGFLVLIIVMVALVALLGD